MSYIKIALHSYTINHSLIYSNKISIHLSAYYLKKQNHGFKTRRRKRKICEK